MAKRPYVQTARYELRCSPEELAAWRHAAEEYGVSLSRYIRMRLNRSDLQLPVLSKNDHELPGFTSNYPKLPAPKNDPALVRQVVAIGNNLNQIAWWCNAHKARQEAEPVEEGIRLVRVALEKLLAQENGGNRP